jgi:hypothetical protein
MNGFASLVLSWRAGMIKVDSSSGVRLLLLRGEICRLARRPGGWVRVLSGVAWVACGGKDYLLRAGEALRLPRTGREPPLLSGIGDDPLIVELGV